jgi:hypothetical protein
MGSSPSRRNDNRSRAGSLWGGMISAPTQMAASDALPSFLAHLPCRKRAEKLIFDFTPRSAAGAGTYLA